MICSTAPCKIRSWPEILATSISCSVSCETETSRTCSQILSEICSCGANLTTSTISCIIRGSTPRCIAGCPPEETHAQLQRSPSWLAKLVRRQTALLCAWKGAPEERPWFHRRFSVSICCTGRSTVWSSMRSVLRSRRNVMIPSRICFLRSARIRSWGKISTTSTLAFIVRGEGAVMCGTAHRRVVLAASSIAL